VSEATELFLSADILRAAIRTQLVTGTSRRAISQLIGAYAPTGTVTNRKTDGVYRVSVELIPRERRSAFLNALRKLPRDHVDFAAEALLFVR
jgi:hypothetical protein